MVEHNTFLSVFQLMAVQRLELIVFIIECHEHYIGCPDFMDTLFIRKIYVLLHAISLGNV